MRWRKWNQIIFNKNAYGLWFQTNGKKILFWNRINERIIESTEIKYFIVQIKKNIFIWIQNKLMHMCLWIFIICIDWSTDVIFFRVFLNLLWKRLKIDSIEENQPMWGWEFNSKSKILPNNNFRKSHENLNTHLLFLLYLSTTTLDISLCIRAR